MRYIPALLLLLMAWQQAMSQVVIQGVIANNKSHAALGFVHVFRKDTTTHSFTGTVSGTDGRFRIVIPKEGMADSLEFSSLGYLRTKRSIASLLKTDTVFLKEEAIYLSPVVVTPLSAVDLIRTSIARVPDNYRHAAFINTCFVWQALETDTAHCSMEESIATLYEEHGASHSRYVLLKDSAISHGIKKAMPVIPPLDSVYKVLYFDFARVGAGVLNSATLPEWRMHYTYDTGTPESYWVVDAERKDRLQHARIFIDPDDYAFRKIEFGYRWKTPVRNRLNDTLYYSLQSVNGTILYEKTERHYGIKYITLQARYTSGSTVPFKPHPGTTTNTATVEYVVLESQEVPVRRNPAAPRRLYTGSPAAVNREAYQRIKAAAQRSAYKN